MAVAAMAATLFRPRIASSPHLGRPGDEASRTHATHYAPIWITHAHARVFLKELVGVTCWQLSLTREPEVKCKTFNRTNIFLWTPTPPPPLLPLILPYTANGLSTLYLLPTPL